MSALLISLRLPNVQLNQHGLDFYIAPFWGSDERTALLRTSCSLSLSVASAVVRTPTTALATGLEAGKVNAVAQSKSIFAFVV